MKTLAHFHALRPHVSLLRDTKSIGELSELIVAAELGRAGYRICIPLGESRRYDLVIDDGAALWRVQVKTGRLRNGAVLFNCYSVNSRNGIRLQSYQGGADFFGVYCPDVQAVYLVPVDEMPRTCFGSLRWSPPKNRQRSKIRWARDYLVSVVCRPEAYAVGDATGVGVGERSLLEPS
jgi:hypothetical protein